MRFENIEVNANGNFPYAVVAQGAQVSFNIPLLLRNITMKGWTKAPVLLDSDFREDGLSNGTPLLKHVDIVHCDMGGVDPEISAITHAGEVIRVQPKPGQGDCYKLTPGANGRAVKEIIPRFAPDVWGTGTGLLGEYYNGNDFTNLSFKRVDPYLDFSEWYDSGTDKLNVNYAIGQNRSFSVKWSGFIEAQFTEEYQITIKASGSHILILDGVKYSNAGTIKVKLNAGQKYAVEILFSNSDIHMRAYSSGGFCLMWNCPSLEKFIKGGEPIPMSQMYPSNVAVTPPPPPPAQNTGPVANAGADITVTLPVASVALTGSATDSDGTIKSYSWNKLTGPSSFSFSNTNVSNPTVSNLEAGIYVFRLTVTDDKNATATDDVQVTVNPATAVSKSVPIASAGADQVITLPLSVATLQGSGQDPDGNQVTYKWTKVSGNSILLTNDTSSSATVVNLTAGVYVFRLTVTDTKGAIAADDVQLTVQAAPTRPGNQDPLKQQQDPLNPENTGNQKDPLSPQNDPIRKPEGNNAGNNTSPLSGSLDLIVTPNPSPTNFNLQVKSTSTENISINIYNRWGRVVESFPNVRNNSTFTIGNNYRGGFYYVHLKQGTATKIVRLLKLL